MKQNPARALVETADTGNFSVSKNPIAVLANKPNAINFYDISEGLCL